MELHTLLRLAVLREAAARKMVRIEGDAELAGVFLGVVESLRWDVEEDLSRVVGDVLAHRLAGTASSFYQWQRHTASNLLESAVEYATEEQSLLAGAEILRRFAVDVDALREAVDRLGKRIDRLAAETPGHPGR
jgi:ubiquinone biosynthesis protein UbiJ